MFPLIAERTCAECVAWWYDEKTGQRMPRFGVEQRRPPTVPTPCRECPKIPADAPVKSRFQAVELNERERMAVEFWQRCRAVNRWPDDEAVEAVAAVLDETERACDRAVEERRQADFVRAVLTAVTAQGK